MKDPRRRPINPFERIALNIADLAQRVTATHQPLDRWEYRQGRHVAPGEYRFDGNWAAYSPAVQWGGEDVTCWFRTTATIPPEMENKEVVVRLFPGGEAILRLNGQPVFGLDFNHRQYVLTESATAGQRFELELECYFRDAPDDAIRNDIRLFHSFKDAELAVIDRELEGLFYDLSAALDLATATETSRPDLSSRVLAALQSAVAAIDPYEPDPGRYRAKALAAREQLGKQLFDHGLGRSAGTLDLVGHCHIDLVYAWPYRESVRKNLRTNLIATDLMRRHTDYIFSQSQAKLFADMQQFHPAEFAAVQKRAAEGRFEPIGGMWVEPDGNIPCGEAMVRQVLYGREYFRKHFGGDSRVCWMPDVFGVSGSLPQILVQSGFTVFYTNKQAIWHDTNEFPHNTFWWEGIDGSRIVAHIPPTHFVGKMDPASLLLQWSEYQQKIEASRVIYTYGFGDGGGGPTEQMIEFARRFARMDGLPALRFSTVEQFARDLLCSIPHEQGPEAGKEQDAARARGRESATNSDFAASRPRGVAPSLSFPAFSSLSVWADELYLEMHRGAQTTKGELKALNRRAETSLRNAELLASVGAILGRLQTSAATLEPAWKTLLECHFHDVVTGTHCPEAGRETVAAYRSVLDQTAESIRQSAAALTDASRVDQCTVFNFTGAARAGHLLWDSKEPVTLAADGQPLPTQRLATGKTVAWIDDLPALGHRVFEVVSLPPPAPIPFTNQPGRITSPHYEARFDEAGRLAGLIDLPANREVLAGPGNALKLYEDKPGRFEAWDISKDYTARPIDAIRFLGEETGEQGELLASRVLRWAVGEKSTIRQEVVFYAHSRRIDFRTEIDWHEERKLLRVEFPVAVLAQRATYEIAFGTISRSARPATSFDQAKFEVAMHRWMDLAECGYGVALLNDSKYGGCVRDGTMSLSLLKSPRFPDITSDIGRHEFTYSLLPHAGDWQSAGVFAEAMLLNVPLQCVRGGSSWPRLDYVAVSRPGVSVEAFKPAQNGAGWIVRLVDYFGQRGPVCVTLPLPVRSVRACNVIEEPVDDAVSVTDGGFEFAGRPFGIHSFRIAF